MKYLGSILILFSTLVSIYAQNTGSYIKLHSPDLVPADKSFEIAAVGRIEYEEVDLCEIILFSDNYLDIDEVKFMSLSGKELLQYYNTGFHNSDETSLLVYFEGEQLEKLHDVFEIIYSIKSPDVSALEINYQVNLFNNNELVHSCSSVEADLPDHLLEPVYVDFYETQEAAGQALVLNQNGYVNFNLDKFERDQLLVEFWINNNSADCGFLSIYNEETGDTLVTISKNRFNLLSITTYNDFDVVDNQLISENAWVHISLYYNEDDRTLSIHGNDRLIFRIYLYDPLPSGLSFFNKKPTEFRIEQLNLWNFENNLSLSFANKNYNNYQADSSAVIYNFNFDDPRGVTNQFLLVDIDFSGIEFSYSDAPIFSKAPEINASVFTNLIIVEWFNREVQGVIGYSLEKSFNNSVFEEIYYVDVFSNSNNQDYSFTDTRDLTGGLVCYRVKQFNSDSTIVYSPQIKIGQAQKRMFELEQNFPNPFNPSTTVNVEILEPGYFEVNIYNVVGIKIESLHKGLLNTGIHQFNFDGSEQPSGIYFVEVKSPISSKVMKMILAK